MIFGIDVSKHQGDINWSAVKNAGVEFAMIRIGYRGYGDGSLQTDVKAVQNIEGCKLAGISYGVYFFSQAVNEAEAREEAQFCLNFLHQHNYKPDYPVCIDQELSGASGSTGRADKNSAAVYAACAVAFCEEIEKANYYALVYCSESWFNSKLGAKLDKYDVWIRKWSSVEPHIARVYGIWQTSNNGTCDGIRGRIDTNIAYKDYSSIIKSKGLNGWTAPENAEEQTKEQDSEVVEIPDKIKDKQNYLLMFVKWLMGVIFK